MLLMSIMKRMHLLKKRKLCIIFLESWWKVKLESVNISPSSGIMWYGVVERLQLDTVSIKKTQA